VVDDLFGRQAHEAGLERAHAAALAVLVKLQRVDLAAVLEDDAHLPGEVGRRVDGA
jgi:hypothetical protein